MVQYWLMKSEPEVYSIDQLENDLTTWWEGVRNYQARNFMMNDMKENDIVLFYHSNASPSGIAGLAKVVKSAQPDPSQFDKKSEYYESRAQINKPIWYCVQVQFVEKFPSLLSLDEIRKTAELSDMLVVQKGQRLSVQPVSEKHFKIVINKIRKSMSSMNLQVTN